MATTVTDDISLPAGLLLVRVDLTELWNTTLDFKVGDTGYAYIADKDSQLVAFRNRGIAARQHYSFYAAPYRVAALLDAVMKMADGNLKQSVRSTYDDELGQLAHSFNRMARQLQQARFRLKPVYSPITATPSRFFSPVSYFYRRVNYTCAESVSTSRTGSEWSRCSESSMSLFSISIHRATCARGN